MREIAPELIFGAVISLYAYVAPYTKVEESFNLQAVHDFIYTDSIGKGFFSRF